MAAMTSHAINLLREFYYEGGVVALSFILRILRYLRLLITFGDNYNTKMHMYGQILKAIETAVAEILRREGSLNQRPKIRVF